MSTGVRSVGVAMVVLVSLPAVAGAQGECGYIGRCSEDLALVDTLSHSPLVTEYTAGILDGEGEAEPFGPVDRFWLMMSMEHCEGGICTEFSQIVEYDPLTCDTFRTIRLPGEIPASGLAYDPEDGSFWYSKGFYSSDLFHVDGNGNPIGAYAAEYNIMGLALDAEHRHLWAIVQGSPDMFLEYDISSGEPVLIQGPFQVPWSQGSSWAAAGLDYNETTHSLVAVNTMHRSLECFLDLEPGVDPMCECHVAATPWPFGVAQVGGPETTFLPDNSFLGPFPLDIYSSCISYMCGETNGDGSVTPSDAYRILNYLGGGPGPLDFRAADLNGDDGLSPADGYQLLNYLGGSGPGLECDEPCCSNCN